MTTWRLTALPEISRWLSAEDTRTALLANQQDRNLFIQKAAALVERSLPMETTQLNTSPAWQQLKRKGYTSLKGHPLESLKGHPLEIGCLIKLQ